MDSTDKPALHIVIPALNEEEIIEQTLARIEGEVALPHEVIVVNDHSTDGTEEVVRRFGELHPNVRVVNNQGQRGFSNALKVGYAAADVREDPRGLRCGVRLPLHAGGRQAAGGQRG